MPPVGRKTGPEGAEPQDLEGGGFRLERSREWWLSRIEQEPDDVTIGAGAPDRPAGASSQCPHSDLHFHLNNAHFGNTNLHYLEIKARCNICGVDMVFQGVPVGMVPDRPAASADGKELRLPFLAEGEELVGKPVGFLVKQS